MLPAEKRQKGLGFLFYEISMFERTASFLKNKQGLEDVTEHAYLESFLTHTRILLEFFYKEGNNYHLGCPQFSDKIKNRPIQMPEEMGYPEICEKLSHLCWQRQDPHGGWNIMEIVNAIIPRLREFFNKIDDDNYPTKGIRKKEDFKQILKPLGIEI